MNKLKLLKVAYSGMRLVKDPNRLEEVFNLADHLDDDGRRNAMVHAFNQDPDLAKSLVERPRMGKIDLEKLSLMPPGSLGDTFYRFAVENHIDPSNIPTLPALSDVEFIKAHLYETHDVFHVVTGFGTDKPGELGLQAFYAAQFPSLHPMLLLGLGFINTMLFEMNEQDRRFKAIVKGWLLGKRAKPFFGTRWNLLWETPLSEIRKNLGIDLNAVDSVLALSDEHHASVFHSTNKEALSI